MWVAFSVIRSIGAAVKVSVEFGLAEGIENS